MKFYSRQSFVKFGPNRTSFFVKIRRKVESHVVVLSTRQPFRRLLSSTPLQEGNGNTRFSVVASFGRKLFGRLTFRMLMFGRHAEPRPCHLIDKLMLIVGQMSVGQLFFDQEAFLTDSLMLKKIDK
jgi:hypothetical protein